MLQRELFSKIKKFKWINKDAFSHGQIQSKLWLCRQIESLESRQPIDLVIVGSWYGLLAFMLQVRERIEINSLYLIDQDPKAVDISKILLDAWVVGHPSNTFLTSDANIFDFGLLNGLKNPVLVNTSCEHFGSDAWLRKVPSGTKIFLQSTNMPHKEHISPPQNVKEFQHRFMSLVDIHGADSLHFSYPTGDFHRFMLWGRKH